MTPDDSVITPVASPVPTVPAPTSPSGLSIASLILGILGMLLAFITRLNLARFGFTFAERILPDVGLTALGLLCALIGVICGHIALGRRQGGTGLSIAGLILGYISGILGLLHLVGLLFFVSLLRHHRGR